jgi:alkanesulfonate monooxygenase SsuD/methylene tetrahydromethanopterin reductase-like flavin-dependent oxidoreductase (luciferase family)
VLSQADKYAKAEEFVSIVTQLWDSLPQEALVADKTTGNYIDKGKTRPIDFHGAYYRSAGSRKSSTAT